MAHVTPEEVRGVMYECTLTDPQIDPYILSAHLLITDILSGKGYSESRLSDIEKYLTAHFIGSINYRPTSREKVGEAEVEYANAKFGEGLKSTPYGEMLLMLDTTGLLAKAGKKVPYFYAVKSFDDE